MLVTDLKCFSCIAERKIAELASGIEPASIPVVHRAPVNTAVAIFNGQTVCEDHIVIQQQSTLSGPGGAPLMLPRPS